MKETINRLSEKQIALITLGLTVIALVVGIALPEIRSILGLEGGNYDSRPRKERIFADRDRKEHEVADAAIPTPPSPPGGEETLTRTEIKQDFANSGAQTGEFVIYTGVTFKNSGFLKGKVVIEKGATFINSGAIEGTVVNKGGTFTNTGFLDGPLKME